MTIKPLPFLGVGLLFPILLFCAPGCSSQIHTERRVQTVNINFDKKGRTFEGIGAISAGCSSRLLFDYPEPYRSEILDFLFKPDFGASLHHFKVEIGGDINATDGTEPSHARTKAELENPKAEFFNRGVEWRLMKEAKKRNPQITLDCLEWGAPGWIGDGKFFSQDNADYIAAFLKGAKKYHNLDIDYTGIWNETPYDANWIKLLRDTLDKNGLEKIKIIAADQVADKAWKIVDDMQKDKQLKKAVSVVGEHYPHYTTPEKAKKCGKPLWASEDGPWSGDWLGADKLAKIYNRNYINGRMTKTVIWPLVTSYYDNLPLPGSGLMRANTPWSGYYEVQPTIWVTAHTTQFAKPGWTYIDSGCGYIEGLGSFVTLQNPSSGDFSIIIETTDSSYITHFMTQRKIKCNLSGRHSRGPIHVWRTNTDKQFVQLEDIVPDKDSFTTTLFGESIYTLTTTTGQHKGTGSPAKLCDFPFPYKDNFDDYTIGTMPKYFIDQGGAFEIAQRDENGGKCLRQITTKKGIEWHYRPDPMPQTFIGDINWSDYQVSCDACIENSGSVCLFGRVGLVPQGSMWPQGYRLNIDSEGKWELKVTENTSAKNWDMKLVEKILANGEITFSSNTWHNLKLRFCGTRIEALADNTKLCEVNDQTYTLGMVGLGSGYNYAKFDNFAVEPYIEIAETKEK